MSSQRAYGPAISATRYVLDGCGGEGVDGRGARLIGGDLRAVGDHLPVAGGGDGDIEDGFEIRLIETGEHPFGVGRLNWE